MAEFANIKKEDCINKALPKGTKLNASHTLVLQSVINTIKAHGRSSMHKEVCGVLIGNLCWDNEAYLLIDACIEGKYAEHQSGSVTFTSNTWDYIHKELSDKYPNKTIVGWYHTHPGFGIFLSNMDIFIHENFFNIRWQPAYVFDPQAEMEGFFFWNKQDLSQENVSVILDEPPVNVESAKRKYNPKISVILSSEEMKENHRRLKSGVVYGMFVLLILINIFSIYRLCILAKETKEKDKEISYLKHINIAKIKKIEQLEKQLKDEKSVTSNIKNLDLTRRVGVIYGYYYKKMPTDNDIIKILRRKHFLEEIHEKEKEKEKEKENQDMTE